jgi:hypothetical protein
MATPAAIGLARGLEICLKSAEGREKFGKGDAAAPVNSTVGARSRAAVGQLSICFPNSRAGWKAQV